MKKLFLIVPMPLLFNQILAQGIPKGLQQQYVSRQPQLDTMRAYPAVPYDSLKVKNDEGVEISFWWLPHHKNKGTALLVHGFFMNKSHMLVREKIYYDLGYNVIVMDLRARGESGGATTTSGPEIRSDVIAVMNYYSDSLEEYGPLVLVGYSHGGRAVVFSAEKKSEKVKGIILESIPYSLTESFKRTYKFTPPPIPEGNIDDAFATLSSTPILLMTGDHDAAIIPAEVSKIAVHFKNRLSKSVVFEQASHDLTEEKYRPLYIESIRTFMASIIK